MVSDQACFTLQILCGAIFVFATITFVLGYTMGYDNGIKKSATDSKSCASRCAMAVNIMVKLWPSTEQALKFMRVIPETQLACSRICIAKQLKTLDI